MLSKKKVSNSQPFLALPLLLTVFLVGCSKDIIVARPSARIDKYPLVIYHHGGGYKKNEPFELRKFSSELSKAGFLVWIIKRKAWPEEDIQGALSDAEDNCEKALDIALKHPEVDKNNINIVGFCLSSWAVFKKNLHSPHVKSMTLLDFGAPFDDNRVYNKVYNLVNNMEYADIYAKVLIIVSKEDTKLSIEPAEIIRKKMIEAKKKVDCIEYREGNESYLDDLIKYLKGDRINAIESIELNTQILDKWNRIRKSGYW